VPGRDLDPPAPAWRPCRSMTGAPWLSPSLAAGALSPPGSWPSSKGVHRRAAGTVPDPAPSQPLGVARLLTANPCSPGPAPWRCADCACHAANAPCRTARPATNGKVRSDRVRFGYRADVRGLRPSRWLLASALPFHLFDAFLQRRVLLAQLFDVRQLPATGLPQGGDQREQWFSEQIHDVSLLVAPAVAVAVAIAAAIDWAVVAATVASSSSRNCN
jgi:hypothetical protein